MKKISIFVSILFAGFSAYGAVPYPTARGRTGVVYPVAAAARAAASDSSAAATKALSAEEEAAAAQTAAIDDIMSRYNPLRQSASEACFGIADGVDKIKVFAGISTGASAVGTIAGGAAAVTGFMKQKEDKDIAGQVVENAAKKLSVGGYIQLFEDIDKIKVRDDVLVAIESGKMLELATKLSNGGVEDLDMDSITAKSKLLGTIRTAGSFAAGGTGVVSAATSFIGLKQFDDVIKNMDSCTASVQGIDRIKSELQLADSTNPALSDMRNIVDSCSGLDSKNIADVKGRMTATGVISSVGGALGIVGGITSLMAARGEKGGALGGVDGKDGGTKGLNTASNYLAVGTTAASLAATIFGGVTVAGLVRNGEIAGKCAGAF
ncbi:MAG: hypothetical protein LBL21_03490 [Rickettsiales bacterium]|jgi:hypothetical protein|nr:hypothetical protein [Rickettsiales bacterium]